MKTRKEAMEYSEEQREMKTAVSLPSPKRDVCAQRQKFYTDVVNHNIIR